MQIDETNICVQWQFEGVHHFPGAEGPQFNDVSFLANAHRHMFHCQVIIEVFHDDRELEFLQVKRDLKAQFGDGEMNNMSCEMMARKIIEYLDTTRPYNDFQRDITVEVYEDGENGAMVHATIGEEYGE